MKVFFNNSLTFDHSGIRPHVTRPSLPIIAILCACISRKIKRTSDSTTYKKERFLKALFYADLGQWKEVLENIAAGVHIPETTFFTLADIVKMAGFETTSFTVVVNTLLHEGKIEFEEAYRQGITMRYRLTDKGVQCAVCIETPDGLVEAPRWQ